MVSFGRIAIVAENRKITLSDEEKQIAIQATKAIGLDVAGVDLIRSKKRIIGFRSECKPRLRND